MVIESLITSKTRVKILKLFVSHIDDRYYLRELERMLEESLSPLRRQLLKLTQMGILVCEEEANLKYYSLNKDFEGIEELRRLVMGVKELGEEKLSTPPLADSLKQEGKAELVGASLRTPEVGAELAKARSATPKAIRYDMLVLTGVSIFILIAAIFMIYVSNKNITQMASIMAGKVEVESKAMLEGRAVREGKAMLEGKASFAATEMMPNEMVSKRWKVLPGNIPVLSEGEISVGKSSKEL